MVINDLKLGVFSEIWGYIPTFLHAIDPASTTEQFNKYYISGWTPFKGFTLDKETMMLTYPEDPPMRPYAVARFRQDIIAIYESAWVCVLKPDGSYEVARMD